LDIGREWEVGILGDLDGKGGDVGREDHGVEKDFVEEEEESGSGNELNPRPEGFLTIVGDLGEVTGDSVCPLEGILGEIGRLGTFVPVSEGRRGSTLKTDVEDTG
jgi:hypothetical protein